MAIYLGDNLQTRGPSVYDFAVAGGYQGTKQEFAELLNNLDTLEQRITNNISSYIDQMVADYDARMDQVEIQHQWVIVSNTQPPADSEAKLWVDTANGNILKYKNGSNWSLVRSVWG